jgi:hypothetical protein
MEHSPSWEANWFAASQEIPRILWNPEGSLPHLQRPPPVSILSQLNPVRTPSSYFLKIHLNIVLPSTSGSPQWSLSLRFPHQTPVHASPLSRKRYMPLSHSSLFYHPHKLGEEYRSWSSSLWSFLHSPVTSSLLGPNILLNTLLSNSEVRVFVC